ncbi:hypothetical protein [Halalkalibacter oceani]|uniref:hypothetical protein n=1 Tax=Halalkalibacter oceani TaxID=1653776 RepID=UPI0033955D13
MRKSKDHYTCFQCKNPVLKIESKKDSIINKDGKIINKYFHDDCYNEFLNNRKEKEELDRICQYVKEEILQYKSNQRVPTHLVRRIQALKSGQEYGVSRNSKVYGNESGYSYEIILKTFKAKKFDIIRGIKDKSKFKNDTHKIDYIMVVIINNINDILERIEAKKSSDKRLNEINLDFSDEKNYKRNKINDNKVANKLRDIW